MTHSRIDPPLSPAAVLSGLLGSWAIERRVDDAATLTGVARFTRSGDDEAVYHEMGTLRLSTGYEAAAHRNYVYRQCSDGFAVFFDEHPQSLFHKVTLVRGAGGCLHGDAEHICAADLYLTCYQFDSATRFRVRHRVRGPRKDYTIVTVYRKVVDSD